MTEQITWNETLRRCHPAFTAPLPCAGDDWRFTLGVAAALDSLFRRLSWRRAAAFWLLPTGRGRVAHHGA